MRIPSKSTLLLIPFLMLFSCKKDAFLPPVQNKMVSVGTFNIYWLHEKNKDSEFLTPGRNDDDYKALATVINKSGADLLVLQEVSSDLALQHLVETLNKEFPTTGWTHKDKSGEILRGKNSNGTVSNRQEVAVIYKKGLMTVTGKEHLFELLPAPKDENLREPLLLHVKVNAEKDATDFDLVAVHYKAMGGSSTWRDTKEKELRNFSNWFKNTRRAFSEEADHSTWKDGKFDPEFIVLGDFNAPLIRQGDNNAIASHELLKSYILPLNLASPIYPRGGNGRYTDTFFDSRYANVIDLAFLSSDLYNLTDKKASVFSWESQIDLTKLRKVRKKDGSQMVDGDTYLRVSDHRPVTIRISTTDSN